MHATRPQPRSDATWNALVDRHMRFDLRATRELHARLIEAIERQAWARRRGTNTGVRLDVDLQQTLASALWVDLVSDDPESDRGTRMARDGWVSWDLLRALDDGDRARLDGWARDRLARLELWLDRQRAQQDDDDPDRSADDTLVAWSSRPTVGAYTLSVAATPAGGLHRRTRDPWASLEQLTGVMPAEARDAPALGVLIDVLVLFAAARDGRRRDALQALRTGLASAGPERARAVRALSAAVRSDPAWSSERADLTRTLEALVALAGSGLPVEEWPVLLTPASAEGTWPVTTEPRVAAWLVWHVLRLEADKRRGMRREVADLLVRWGYAPSLYNSLTAWLGRMDPLVEAALAATGAHP